MRSKVKMNQKKSGSFGVKFLPAQRDAVLSVLELMLSLPVDALELAVQVGASREEISRLGEDIRQADLAEELQLEISDLHRIHCLLLCSLWQFPSEEAFYIRIGFFRENIVGLARGIVGALGGLHPAD